MITEIPNPYPSIFEIIEHDKLIEKLKKINTNNLGLYDVNFNSDYTLVKEFSEKCDVDEETALSFLIVFFEEIKKELINGRIVSLPKFGKFYLNGPHKGKEGYSIIPSNKSRLLPKFKASVLFKRELKKLAEK